MMQNKNDKYWILKLERCQKNLERNNFSAFVVHDCVEAKRIVMAEILPNIPVRSVSYGDSLTLHATNVLEEIRHNTDFEFVDTFAKNTPREEILERRRQALIVDLFFTGTNAVTESGQLVNLDMLGNRVAAITFGPRNVVLFVGRNKIVSDLEAAMKRVKYQAAPMNAIRHASLKTPCTETGQCADCNSSRRLCNIWSITEKSYPKGRITVVLINKDLGL
ncbi:lactate utilization protein [candidate division CSSED10-310 bacterium]|uniref:Lactate utilization protein n=1 Tax=candidate division CSSED10-310 bacterium TaxID=2855610 RepID=A0ABV6YUK0_UNCC1